MKLKEILKVLGTETYIKVKLLKNEKYNMWDSSSLEAINLSEINNYLENEVDSVEWTQRGFCIFLKKEKSPRG